VDQGSRGEANRNLRHGAFSSVATSFFAQSAAISQEKLAGRQYKDVCHFSRPLQRIVKVLFNFQTHVHAWVSYLLLTDRSQSAYPRLSLARRWC
jgi:hypothetical protein